MILASGTADPKVGGSGARKLLEAMRSGELEAIPVGLVSNHEFGSIYELAKEFGVPFFYSPKGRTAEDHQRFVRETKADFVSCSGWLGIVKGLPFHKVINIHPAWLPSKYGGEGWYGDHVHQAVWEDYQKGLVTHHGVSMHFVTDKIDDERFIFLRKCVEIMPNDTWETLKARVNAVEHGWQVEMTNRIVMGQIYWDGDENHPVMGAVEIDKAA